MSANEERTFIAIKPDGVQRGLIGKIIKRFEKRGFKMVALKICSPGRAHLETHYADLSKKPFFGGLVEYMCSGPIVCMVWEGMNMVKQGRMMLGETNPMASLPGTIRGDFSIDIGRNICHGSDSVESANNEIDLWFTKDELIQWNLEEYSWIYEEPIEEPVMINYATLSDDELVELDNFLSDKSYLDGFLPTQTDVFKFQQISEKQYLSNFCENLKNLRRWWKHILTFKSEFSNLPGEKKTVPICDEFGAGDAPVMIEKEAIPDEEAEDSDLDLFGSDEEDDEEAERIKAERIAEYNKKKGDKESKKGKLIAKSNIILDVKPWDDETDMAELEKNVRSIQMDGLLWGTSKLVAIGYGIKKFQITCVVEDDKVGTDDLEDKIVEFEDYVQSMDIVAFNKI